jgi:hypothetical protein
MNRVTGPEQVRLDTATGRTTRTVADLRGGQVAGISFTTPGWAAGAAGFDIDATAGAARVAVAARAS